MKSTYALAMGIPSNPVRPPAHRTKNQFPLHKEAIEEASHIELALAISAVIVELRRRALLSKSNDMYADRVRKNAMKRALEHTHAGL